MSLINHNKKFDYKDVRSGNTLLSHLTNKLVEVNWLVIKHLEDGNVQSLYTPDIPVYHPIKLTHKVLEDCNFEKGSSGWFSPGFSSNIRIYHSSLDGWSFDGPFYYATKSSSVIHEEMRIEYLHDLQNLYYTIYKKELIYNPYIKQQEELVKKNKNENT